MMNDLLNRMAADMSISSFQDESMESFVYRICYSALGQWCLATAKCNDCRTSKHNQTIVMKEILTRLIELFPFITDRFINTGNQQVCLCVHIRRLYEETGYLLTDENNHNRLANYGRSIQIGSKSLFFGLPITAFSVNGLGVYTDSSDYLVNIRDFLIRDKLNCEEFFRSRFDSIDFYDRDIELQELEFFNPKSKNVPSHSWSKSLYTDCTVARKSERGPFYRVMKISDLLQFADESMEQQNDGFTSYEYRRLYFALKYHYKNQLKANIKKIDKLYSKIKVGGHLPNREYYLLLLMTWPEKNAFDKGNFIILNEFLPVAIDVLENIGIEIKGGTIDAKQ